MDDQYSHKKMLQNGKFDVLKNLEEQFDESIYPSAQKQSLQHGIENNVDEVLEVSQGSNDLLDVVLLQDETLIIMESNIIEFKDKQTMY